jgi:hypothetical protein
MTLLGDSPIVVEPAQHGPLSAVGPISKRAQTWMTQHGVSMQQLSEVFHLDEGKAEFIGELPGKSKLEKTHNAFVLVGIGNLISTGDAKFSDQTARDLCISSGCYDIDNHAAYMKKRGNEFTGSKDKGWVLTAPGMKRGAELITALTGKK